VRGALSGILLGAGVLLAVYARMPFGTGAWLTAGVLVVFAFVGRNLVSRESAADPAA
jgi:hypothetical protein